MKHKYAYFIEGCGTFTPYCEDELDRTYVLFSGPFYSTREANRKILKLENDNTYFGYSFSLFKRKLPKGNVEFHYIKDV